MMLPFLPRLVIVCLASFFLVNLAIGLCIRPFVGPLSRIADGMSPRSAARMLLLLRLAPPFLGLLAAIWIAVNYPALEPQWPAEEVGYLCLLWALLSAAAWALSLARSARAVLRARRYVRRCRQLGVETRLPGERSPAWIVNGEAPFFLMTGILRHRLIVSQSAIRVLSTEELAVAVRHERAHRVGRDNLKRLLFTLSPGMLPFVSGLQALEREWMRLAEWAADDRAVAGIPGRALTLADVLVRLAREGVVPEVSLVSTPLLGSVQNLAVRVDRLLEGKVRAVKCSRGNRVLAACTILAGAVALAAVAERPATLHTLHELLEHLHLT